jgi:hypothetical protein
LFGRKKAAKAEVGKPRIKVTDKNSVYWQFSWIVEGKNSGGEPLNIGTLTIKFVDNKGFVLHEQLIEGFADIAGRVKQEFKGATMIERTLAGRVKGAEVELRSI